MDTDDPTTPAVDPALALLDTTLEPARAAADWRVLHAGPPTGPGWYPLAEITAGDLLARWFDDVLAGDAAGQRDVATAFLAGWIADIVAGAVVHPTVHAERAWPSTVANLAVRRNEAGWFDGLAILGPAVYLLPHDPAAGADAAVVLPDAPTLHRTVAAELTAVLDGMFAAIRRLGPFGLAGMWGQLADSVASAALWPPRPDDPTTPQAWATVERLLDELAGHAPLLRARPGIEHVTWTGGSSAVAAKGTCCLAYKTADGPPPAPDGDAWCTSCPKRSPSSRHDRWAAYFDTEGAH